MVVVVVVAVVVVKFKLHITWYMAADTRFSAIFVCCIEFYMHACLYIRRPICTQTITTTTTTTTTTTNNNNNNNNTTTLSSAPQSIKQPSETSK
jgi:hypothetical protein